MIHTLKLFHTNTDSIPFDDLVWFDSIQFDSIWLCVSVDFIICKYNHWVSWYKYIQNFPSEWSNFTILLNRKSKRKKSKALLAERIRPMLSKHS
jgi:hypothetical protein